MSTNNWFHMSFVSSESSRYSLPPRGSHVVSRALVWLRWIILLFFIFLSFLSSHLDFRICILQKNKVGCPKNFSVKFGPYFYYCYFYKLFFFQLHPLILNLLGIGFCNSSYLLWRNPSLMTRFASLLSWPKFDQVFFIIIFQIFFFSISTSNIRLIWNWASQLFFLISHLWVNSNLLIRISSLKGWPTLTFHHSTLSWLDIEIHIFFCFLSLMLS